MGMLKPKLVEKKMSEYVMVRMSLEQKQALVELAQRDDRDLSSYVRRLMLEHMRSEGVAV